MVGSKALSGLALASVLGVTGWLVAGCSAKVGAPPAPVCNASQGTKVAAQDSVASDTAFAAAFYEPAAAAAGTGRNFVVSPYSVSATMKMVDVGAAGNTDAQIRSVLQLSDSAANLGPAYAAVACQDETDGTAMGNTLSIANSLWGQKDTAFETSFLSVLSTGYRTPLQQVDFAGDPGGAAGAINDWVSTNTDGAIPTILQPGDVDQETRLVLVDAVYFKGTWETGFDPSQTSARPFTLSDGTMIQVPTMSGSTVHAAIGYGQEVRIYEVPYVGGRFAMDFLLPTDTTTPLDDLETKLTAASVATAVGTLGSYQPSQVLLPKFSFTTQLSLVSILEQLGITDAFDPSKANLSGMDGAMDLFVAAVKQQALVLVDESGTVAAAATEATGSDNGAAAGPPPQVIIDRPFLFLIRDTQNGSVLFMGRVDDPRPT